MQGGSEGWEEQRGEGDRSERSEIPVGEWRASQAVSVPRARMMGCVRDVDVAGEEGVYRERALWIG